MFSLRRATSVKVAESIALTQLARSLTLMLMLETLGLQLEWMGCPIILIYIIYILY